MKAPWQAVSKGGRAQGYALVLLAATCWAGGGLIAKWLFTAAAPENAAWPFPPLGIAVDPVVLSAARALLAAVIAVGYLLLRRRDLLSVRRSDLLFLTVFGVFGLALVHFAYFKTISLTGVATAILLEYLAPIIVLVVSVSLLGERFTWTLPAAVTASVTGCALMVGAIGGQGLSISVEGLMWGLVSAVLFAGYALMGRYAAPRFSPWTLLAYGLTAASLFWLIVLGGPGRIIELLSDPRAAAAVVVLAVVSTVVPFGAFLKALQLIEATQASVTSTLEPVVAGVAAWFVFGEHLSSLQIAGGFLVLVAVMLSQLSTRVAVEMPLTTEVDPLQGPRTGA